MKLKIFLFLLCAIGFYATPSQAVIVGTNSLEIDFTNANDAANKATWADEDQIKVTQNGLAASGTNATWKQFWMMTKSLAVGLAWRPITEANITVQIEPPIKLSGSQYEVSLGTLYVRYGVDAKHWSSWQVLTRDQGKAGIRMFHGSIEVPQFARLPYLDLFYAYQEKNRKEKNEWENNEEVIVQRIAKDNPAFFDAQFPFIGYVEFLYEVDRSEQVITSFSARLSWAVSGLTSAPKDPKKQKPFPGGAWRFKAE